MTVTEKKIAVTIKVISCLGVFISAISDRSKLQIAIARFICSS